MFFVPGTTDGEKAEIERIMATGERIEQGKVQQTNIESYGQGADVAMMEWLIVAPLAIPLAGIVIFIGTVIYLLVR